MRIYRHFYETFCGPNHIGLEIVDTFRAESAQNMNVCLFSCCRPGRPSLGLPGRGVRSAGQHRTLQQSTLRQEPQQPGLPACGQLPAKRSGTAGGLARRLPNELWPLAGAGGLLQTYLVGRTATVRLMNCTRPPTWNKTGRTSHGALTDLIADRSIMLRVPYTLELTEEHHPRSRRSVLAPTKCFTWVVSPH